LAGFLARIHLPSNENKSTMLVLNNNKKRVFYNLHQAPFILYKNSDMSFDN
jgi:hypothetical protein